MQGVSPVNFLAFHSNCNHSNDKSRLQRLAIVNGLAINVIGITGPVSNKGQSDNRTQKLTPHQLNWTAGEKKLDKVRKKSSAPARRTLQIPPTSHHRTLSPASLSSPTDEEIQDFLKSKAIQMDRTYKLLTIGDPGVGKTSFVQRYVHGYFTRDYKATLGGFKIFEISEPRSMPRVMNFGISELATDLTVSGDFLSSFRFKDWVVVPSEPVEYPAKVIVVGDAGVGKTSFVHRYISKKFTGRYKWTVGVDFALKLVKWSDNVTIKLQLWDIAGQERFTSMTRVYYRDAHACIIMFDLTQRSTFENALRWKRDLDSKCAQDDGSPVPCILLANKCDLGNREIRQEEIESFCREENFVGWTEVSVKEGMMVEESMSFLLDDLMKRYGHLEKEDSDAASVAKTIQLRHQQSAIESEQSKCSC